MPKSSIQQTPRLCTVTDCALPKMARGFCTLHYYRWKRHGSPTAGRRYVGTGSLHAAGYWSIRVNGKYELEHRVIWEKAHGPIPKGHHVHHKNGNKRDNRLENLELLPSKDHCQLHHPKRICLVANCGKDCHGHGFCQRHYNMWKCRDRATYKGNANPFFCYT